MNRYKSLGLVGLAAASLFASQAFAATICPAAPVGGTATMSGSPVCIASYGADGDGTGLQDQIDLLTTAGTPINVYNDQAGPNSSWSLTSGGNTNTILLEIAGNKNLNTFGIYDLNDPSNMLQLFNGTAGAGVTVSLMHNADNTFTAGSTTSSVFGSGNMFGYFLGTPSDGIFYSNPSMNAPGSPTYFPGGMQQFVEYQGNGSTLQTGASQTVFDPSMYLLAWEDQPFGGSDLDYNDFVVLVTANPTQQVPEPAVLGMFGFGALIIGLFAGLRRRREDV